MKLNKLLATAMLGAALGASTLAMAADPNPADAATTAKMSKVMMQLNHHPSAQEKDWLNKVANDNSQSASVRTIARAIANLEHKASESDKQKLSAVMEDKTISENVRELARIVRDVNHQPSADDQKRLSAMAAN